MSATPIANPSIAPTVAQFLADYPKFDTSQVSDPNALQFSPESIAYWLQMATIMLNQAIFANLYYMACELFVAHNVALEAYSEQGGDQTVPGITKGAIAASASGDVSVSYNNAAVLELDAGHWGYTTYGGRLLRLIRLVGAGPLQVTGGCCPGPNNGPAWQGPFPWNFPNPNCSS
jgi:hypothetical protein